MRTLDDGWALHDYGDLARRVRGVSAQLRAAGVAPGDRVIVPAGDVVDFVCHLFGTLHAGATAVPLGPGDVATVARVSGARFAVAAGVSEALAPRVRVIEADGRCATAAEAVPPAATALIQFTSGSSAAPRAVPISRANLEANVQTIARWLGIGPDDAAASWLPLHHDMGLIGLLIVPVACQMTLWSMRPRDFLLRPRTWLECFGTHGATLGAAPDFAYGLVARRVRPDRLAEMDFSRWRVAIAGAERLTASLGRFAALLQPCGFDPKALRPAYGLAEATLAVTGHTGDDVARVAEVDAQALAPGRPVRVRRTRPLTAPSAASAADVCVASGPPLPGNAVEICDDAGRPLPDGVLGEIVVRGPGVAAGYLGAPAGSTRFEDGLVTGDAGFLLDGELFVLGRMADGLKVRGRMWHAEGLEHELAEGLGVPVTRCAVVARWTDPAGGVAAIVEQPPGDWAPKAVELLRARLGSGVPVTVHAGPILRTTSGKPRRRAIWDRLAASAAGAEEGLQELGALGRE